jgi:hypothetical protein
VDDAPGVDFVENHSGLSDLGCGAVTFAKSKGAGRRRRGFVLNMEGFFEDSGVDQRSSDV